MVISHLTTYPNSKKTLEKAHIRDALSQKDLWCAY